MYIEEGTLLRRCDSAQQLFKDFTHARNVSKKVQKKEFMEYFQKQGTSPKVTRHLYEKFDKNGDCGITFKEFFENIFLESKTMEELAASLEQKEIDRKEFDEVKKISRKSARGSAVASSPRKSRLSEKSTGKSKLE